MKKIFAILSFTLAAGFLISGCSGSSSSSAPASAVTFSVPSAISPVPTNSTTVATSKLTKGIGLGSMLAGVAATDAGTDYSNATTSKHVEEHVLSQFAIINTILDALSQTHFSDSGNLGAGPYKALISWKQDNSGGGPQGGGQQKTIQQWIVDSSIVVENGQNVNQVLAWIQDSGQLIRVKVKIYASPTLKTDGSYQDYGIWTINAVFDPSNPSLYFAASASIGSSGEAIVKFHDNTHPSQETKAILNTSNGSGYGEISYPDFSSCHSQNCSPPMITAKYSYDGSTVGVITTDGTNITGPSFRSRTSRTDVTMSYGLYDSVTGADVLKTKDFGFPVKYTLNGTDNYAYYGSWQGRHSLWASGGTVPPGTTLTRMDLGPNQTETYMVTSASNFSGSLTKRTLIASDINNILNLPVSTWTNMSITMVYSGTTWCNAAPGTTNCASVPSPTALAAELVADPNNPNQSISISGTINGISGNFVYDSTVAGFFAAISGPNGTWTKTGTAITPVTGNQLWVNIGGSIFIEYTNKGNIYSSGNPVWVKKTITAFDQQTNTPTFNDTADTAYPLTSGQQYYLMNQGTNFVYTNGLNSSAFQIEVQTVANPANATTFTGTGTVFTPQWSNGYSTNYTFVTSSNDPRYLNLVYNTVDSHDQNLALLNAQPGHIVTTGIYGLVANDGTQYNWDYATSQNPYGLLTYLVGPGTSTAFKLLDDPISLQSFSVTNISGANPINVSLMYSGWMSGIPDIYNDLMMTDWVMTPDLQTKVYNIPDATPVNDATDNTKHYLIRPLQITEFLNPITTYSGTLNPSTVIADLSTVPTVDTSGIIPEMTTVPSITTIKYSEGNLVQ
jgi:hypothetical protein